MKKLINALRLSLALSLLGLIQKVLPKDKRFGDDLHQRIRELAVALGSADLPVGVWLSNMGYAPVLPPDAWIMVKLMDGRDKRGQFSDYDFDIMGESHDIQSFMLLDDSGAKPAIGVNT